MCSSYWPVEEREPELIRDLAYLVTVLFAECERLHDQFDDRGLARFFDMDRCKRLGPPVYRPSDSPKVRNPLFIRGE